MRETIRRHSNVLHPYNTAVAFATNAGGNHLRPLRGENSMDDGDAAGGFLQQITPLQHTCDTKTLPSFSVTCTNKRTALSCKIYDAGNSTFSRDTANEHIRRSSRVVLLQIGVPRLSRDTIRIVSPSKQGEEHAALGGKGPSSSCFHRARLFILCNGRFAYGIVRIRWGYCSQRNVSDP